MANPPTHENTEKDAHRREHYDVHIMTAYKSRTGFLEELKKRMRRGRTDA